MIVAVEEKKTHHKRQYQHCFLWVLSLTCIRTSRILSTCRNNQSRTKKDFLRKEILLLYAGLKTKHIF